MLIEGETHPRAVRFFADVLRHGKAVIGLSALLAAAGVLALFALPRDLFPDLALPAVQVLIQSPGRDAAELELGIGHLVAEKIAGVSGEFPPGTAAPLLTSAAGRLQEIQELVLEGPAVDPMKLRDTAVQLVVPRLQSVPGVARIELLGGEDRQLQVSLS